VVGLRVDVRDDYIACRWLHSERSSDPHVAKAWVARSSAKRKRPKCAVSPLVIIHTNVEFLSGGGRCREHTGCRARNGVRDKVDAASQVLDWTVHLGNMEEFSGNGVGIGDYVAGNRLARSVWIVGPAVVDGIGVRGKIARRSAVWNGKVV